MGGTGWESGKDVSKEERMGENEYSALSTVSFNTIVNKNKLISFTSGWFI